MPEIETNLGTLRRKSGLSAIQLAHAAGVSRQTIHAIEAGTFIPNTSVALLLARALDTQVEEIFGLVKDQSKSKPRSAVSELLPGSQPPLPGQAVQLCRVDRRLMACPPFSIPWYFPASDAVLADKTAPSTRQARVEIFQEDRAFADRLLLAGCDPSISVLARHVQNGGATLVLTHRNSSQALSLLKEGCVHLAGTHLKDEHSDESNLPQIQRLFPKNSVAVIAFAMWEEGILTARKNPKGIREITDFARKDVRLVNRENGSGSRALLDSRLKRAGIRARTVRGYDSLAAGHLQAACQIQAGLADCGIATRAAARSFGLHFIPLVSERYDLVIRKQHLKLPLVQNLLDALNRASFRRELEALGGYDTRVTGKQLL